MPRQTTATIVFGTLADLRTWVTPVIAAAKQQQVALSFSISGGINTVPGQSGFEHWTLRVEGPQAFLDAFPDP